MHRVTEMPAVFSRKHRLQPNHEDQAPLAQGSIQLDKVETAVYWLKHRNQAGLTPRLSLHSATRCQ